MIRLNPFLWPTSSGVPGGVGVYPSAPIVRYSAVFCNLIPKQPVMNDDIEKIKL